jgi:PAS domain S-box-containing protein
MKISRKISLGFLVVGLILATLSGAIAYTFAKDALVKSRLDKLNAVCAAEARHIETYLEMLEYEAVRMSESVVLRDLLKIGSKGDALWDEAFKREVIRYLATSEVIIHEFFLMDRTGIVAASSDEGSVGTDRSQDAIFIGAREGVHIKEPYLSASFQEPLMAVSAPISDHRTGEFLGVVAAKVGLGRLNSITTDRIGLGETGETYIVNKHGYMITPSRKVKDAVLKQKVDTENLRRARLHEGKGHPLPGKEMKKVFTDYIGVKVFGTHEYIPGTEWIVLTEMDEKEVLAPAVELRMIFFLLVFFTPVAAWLLGGVIAGTIIRPLRKLHRGAEIIARGDLGHKVGTGDNDEVGQLSRAFDDMTESLRKKTTSIDTLNKEISERKKAEEKYRSMKKRVDFVLAASKTTLDILDPDLNIIYVDEMWKTLYGDYEGRKCYEYFMGRSQACSECGAKKALETKKIVRSEEVLVREGNRSIEVISIPFQDEDGKWLAAEVNVDITERKRAEKEIEKARDQYQSLVGNIPGIVYRCMFDNDWTMLFISEAVESITGYPAGDFIQNAVRTYESVIHPDDTAAVSRSIKESATAGQPWDIEYRLCRKDGDIRWVQERGRGVPGEDGKIAHLDGFILDVTERKRAEESLLESEKRFMDVLYSSDDAILLIGDNKFVDCNQATVRMLGYATREEILQTHPSELSPPKQPDGRSSFEKADEMMKGALEKGFRRFEWMHRRASGEDFPVEVSLTPIVRKGEKMIYCVWRDITELKRTQTYLELFQRVLAISSDAVGIAFPNGRLYYRNEAFSALFGEVGKDHVKDLYENSKVAKEVFSAVSSGGQWSGEAKMRAADGSIRDFLLRSYAVKKENGDIEALVGVHTDITEQKQAEERLTQLLKEEVKHREIMISMLDDNNRIRERLEEKLEEVQKFQQQIIQSEKLASLGRMVAEIAHEINNPLQAVSGNAQLLMLEEGLEGTVAEGLKTIEQQCYRARDIIKRLLLFAKPGKMNVVEKDINEVVEDAIKLIETSLHLSSVRILREYAREEIKVDMDVVQIEEVFMNLLRNSMEAMDKGGTVTVSTGSKGGKAWVSIKDTGSGMSKETMEHIFDPFYTTKETGTGLGLSVCFGIVKAHCGEIRYESEPGEGTKAVVFIPMKA